MPRAHTRRGAVASLALLLTVGTTGCGPKSASTAGDVPRLDEADAAARGYLESVPEIADEIGKLSAIKRLDPGGVFSGKSAEGDALLLTYRLKGPKGEGKAKVWLLLGEVAWTPIGCRARVRGKTVRVGREVELGAGDPEGGLD